MPILKRILCSNLPKRGSPVPLSETESHHAIRVLRLRNGTQVEAMDAQGNHLTCLLKIRNQSAFLEFQAGPGLSPEKETGPRQDLPIVLELAILKGAAMEWAVEKAVELGVEKLVPVVSQYTVVQTQAKGPEFFQERWQKIADQALKQCGRWSRMEVTRPTQIEELLAPEALKKNNSYLWFDEAAYQNEKTQAPYLMEWIKAQAPGRLSLQTKVHLLVGPEGGWSFSERETLSNQQISFRERLHLGPLVLRAETAAVMSTCVIAAWLRGIDASTLANS